MRGTSRRAMAALLAAMMAAQCVSTGALAASGDTNGDDVAKAQNDAYRLTSDREAYDGSGPIRIGVVGVKGGQDVENPIYKEIVYTVDGAASGVVQVDPAGVLTLKEGKSAADLAGIGQITVQATVKEFTGLEYFQGFEDVTRVEGGTDAGSIGDFKTLGAATPLLNTERAVQGQAVSPADNSGKAQQMAKDFGAAKTGVVSALFYDDGTHATTNAQFILSVPTAAEGKVNGVGISGDADCYGRRWEDVGSFTNTSVSRTVGWHLIEYVVDGTAGLKTYLDGEEVLEGARPSQTSFRSIGLSFNWGTASGGIAVDSIAYARNRETHDIAAEPVTIPVAIPVTGIAVQGPTGVRMDQPSPAVYTAEVVPGYASTQTVDWSVVNGTGAAAIDAAGALSPTRAGTVTVKAAAQDGSGVTGSLEVTITETAIPPERLAISGSATVILGSKAQYTAQVFPAIATDKSVTWSVVEGEALAEIDAATGVLTPKAVGAVTIKAVTTEGAKEDAFSLTIVEQAPPAANPLRLHYDTPAAIDGRTERVNGYDIDVGWERYSLPIGNGYMGVNVFGGQASDRLQLSEKTLWTGGPGSQVPGGTNTPADKDTGEKTLNYFGNHPTAYKYWPAARDAAMAGNYKEAQSIVNSNMYMSNRYALGDYQNFAEIYMDFPGLDESKLTGYYRELNLENAVAGVGFTDENGITYRREYFTSYPDNVFVMRFTADQAGAVSFDLKPAIPHMRKQTVSTSGTNAMTSAGKYGNVKAEGDTITLSGSLMHNGLQFEAQFKVIPDGGTLTAVNTPGAFEGQDQDNGKIEVRGANSVIVIVSCGTDYKNEYPTYRAAAGEPHASVTQRLEAAVEKGYEALRTTHEADYKGLFDRVDLDLSGVQSDKDTDEVLAGYKSGALDEAGKRYLETLYFQYGRYLLISSSRDGALPANLQGVWNAYPEPPWQGDYHFNINLQMNYWPAYNTNLKETALALIDYVDTLREPGRETVQSYFGPDVPGWLVFLSNNIFGYTGTINATASWQPADTAWICQNLWEYYTFTLDEDLLREKIYPIMYECAQVYAAVLKENPNHGNRLEMAPSYSAEHGPFTSGTTFDQELIWQLYTDLIQAADVLGIGDDPLLATIAAQREKLNPLIIGESGQIKEWYEETTYNNITSAQAGHRHISQLVGLYPGNHITTDTVDLMEAAKVTLTKRGDAATGWSMGNKINLWARTGDGNHAYVLFGNLLKNGTLPNLWDTHDPFQIDGNLGGTAGVAEMLLQSHQGYLRPLAALPDAWADGSVSGLMARGNFETEITWENGRLSKLRILSNAGAECSVAYPGLDGVVVRDGVGQSVAYTHQVTGDGTDQITFPTTRGGTYTITVSTVTIQTQPQAETYLEPGSISGSLAVSAAASDGSAVTYQWYVSATATGEGEPIQAATASVFPLPAGLANGTYYYYCVASAPGAVPAASQRAMVRVAPNGGQGFTASVEALAKGASAYLTTSNGLGYIFDGFTPFSNDKVSVDGNGRVTLKEGYVPAADETVSVDLTLGYYHSADAVYHEDFEGAALSPMTSSATAGEAGKYTQEKAGLYALTDGNALTGSKALTIGDTSGALFYCFDGVAGGKITAWYYDACDDLGKNTTYDSTRFSVGVSNTKSNTLTSIVGVHYFKNGAAEVGSQTHYSGRDNQGMNDSTNTPIARSAGWHKIVWDLDGKKLLIDGVDTGYRNTPASVNTIHFATNWAAQAGAQAYLKDKNFVDNVSVLPTGAERKTATVTVQIKLLGDQDQAAVEAAKTQIEAADFTAEQARAGSEAAALAEVRAQIGALALNGVTAGVDKVGYTPAQAGAADKTEGVNGSLVFTVTLTKGSAAVTTAPMTLVIRATPYDPAQDNADIAAAKALIEKTAFAADQADAGTEAGALAQVQAQVNALPLSGVSALVKKGAYTPAQAGTADQPAGVPGSLAFTVALTKGAGSQAVTGPLTLTITPTPYQMPQDVLDVAEAKGLLEAADYATTQAETPDEDAALALAERMVEAIAQARDVAAAVTKVSYLGPVAGTEAAPQGTDGKLIFTVRLTKGGAEDTTAELVLTISAAPYEAKPPYIPPVTPKDPETKPDTAPAGDGTVEKRENQDGSITYTFVPAGGRELKCVRVNGLTVKAEGSLTAGPDDRVVAVFGAPGADPTRRFTDLDGVRGEALQAVGYVLDAGLFDGAGKTTFAPQAGMSRAMFATVLARLYGADTAGLTAAFSDVEQDAWYAPGVAWAAERGYVQGVGGTAFAPERGLTRQELVTLVFRFAESVGVDVSARAALEGYQDRAALSGWAQDAMSWAVSIGLVNGCPGNLLAPEAPISRVEAAIVLERMSRLLLAK